MDNNKLRKPMTEETKCKISISITEYKHTAETRGKMSIAKRDIIGYISVGIKDYTIQSLKQEVGNYLKIELKRVGKAV
ncbi:MAG: NUMOD3 domain-containing DNA-binding protein [Nitrososphaeraceae archaeon]